ncbi:hypothetical protein GW17_00024027 [Ensete ventricosum]|nr:hypothetical protein GW17_00024027 [Ensete ventricosum]
MVDFDRRRSLSGSSSRFRLSAIDFGREKEEGEEKGNLESGAARAIHRSRAISSPRAGRRNVSPCGDKEQGDVFINTEMYARASVAALFYKLANFNSMRGEREQNDAVLSGKMFLLELLDSVVWNMRLA